jgi:predicted nucleic acid-binding protein
VPYADTDFFIALSNSKDRLNPSALSIYKAYKGRIYTSIAVIIELALVSVKRNQPVEKLISSVISIALLQDSSKNKALVAAHLIDNEGIGVFDAFHAALCDNEIISSDHVYDRLKIKRIMISPR